MKKSTKAALLSAFVLPGAGHIYLKKYVSGITLTGVTFIAMYYLISKAVETALKILEKIQWGDVAPDVTVITELLLKQTTGAEVQAVNVATFAIIICWLIGIADSYRIGWAQDKKE